MARTSVANTIQRIRRQASSGYRNETNVLAIAMDASTTNVTLVSALTPNIQVGAVLCIGIESMRVTAINAVTQSVTVIRGWLDSDPDVHNVNDEVQINPRFSPLDIYDGMITELQSWGPALHAVVGITTTVAADQETLELPISMAGCYGIIDIRHNWTAAVNTSTAWPQLNFRFQRGVGTTWTGASTSGLLIRSIEPMNAGSLYIIAAVPFSMSAFAFTADLISDIGIKESMLDVLEMGVKLRMGMDNEIQRGARTQQDEPRRAEENPAGSLNAGFQLQNAIYRNRKAEEIQKLRTQYPIRYS